MSGKSELKIHPAAECFRLMYDDELAALAEDIKMNGLRDVLTSGNIKGSKEKFLVDGRNRLRACEIVGIEPRYEHIEFANDAEVVAFVKSRGERRDLTKAQRAMALAMLHPEPPKGGRGKKGASDLQGFSHTLLTQARAVLRHSRGLAEAVRDGTKKLDVACDEIMKERQRLQSTETKMYRLRSDAPDLAAFVADERMDIDEALGALDAREHKIQQIIDAGCHAANGSMKSFVSGVSSIIEAAKVGETVKLTKEQAKQVENMLAVETLDMVLAAAQNLKTVFSGG